MKISRNWLQTYFNEPLPAVEELEQALALHSFETEGIEEYTSPKVGEVPDAEGYDQVIDIDVLPNRAHDALCHRGVARDIAAILDSDDYHESDRYTEVPATVQNSDKRPLVTIKNPEQCRRYMSRIIENIEVKESPQWLKDQLEAIGQRSINNVVDATNYIMFDLGNPIHAFDMDKVAGNHIIVRNALEGETMKTLGGQQELTLDESMLLITDEDAPLALAGVKGGNKAEVNEKTTNLILEVGNFEPLSTRKTRQKTGVITDSSKRFENELNVERVPEAMDALTELLVTLAGSDTTRISETVDEFPYQATSYKIEVSLGSVNGLLGTTLGVPGVEKILQRLRFVYAVTNENFSIEVPKERLDIRISADIIEEIGRIYGYHNITPQGLDHIDFKPKVHTLTYYQNKVRDILTQEGFTEVMTYSFQKGGAVSMLNPVAKDRPFLRTSLRVGLSESLEKNLYQAELFNQETIKIFEFGKCFSDTEESLHLGIAVGNKTKKARKQNGEPKEQIVDILKKLEVVVSSQLPADNLPEDGIFEINFEEAIEGLSVPENYENLDVVMSQKHFTSFSAYPCISRDIAIWVDENIQGEEVKSILKTHAGELAVRLDLFDEFTKEGKTSYAFRIIFQSMEKTLSDEEINPVMETITKTLEEKGWEVR
jgi:phenylalanyl-tRNA synthetase beta chain